MSRSKCTDYADVPALHTRLILLEMEIRSDVSIDLGRTL